MGKSETRWHKKLQKVITRNAHQLRPASKKLTDTNFWTFPSKILTRGLQLSLSEQNLTLQLEVFCSGSGVCARRAEPPPPPSKQSALFYSKHADYYRRRTRTEAMCCYTVNSMSTVFTIKIICFQFKGWNQLHHQPDLKFPLFFPASLQAKTAGISKSVDVKADVNPLD